jgi:Fe-S cluster biogenesis protein NfuA
MNDTVAEAPRPDRIANTVAALSAALDTHAGGLELVSSGGDGSVEVRFTGMCTGCPLRPVSFNGLVKPALLAIDGVRAVHAHGGRISAEAEARLTRQLELYGSRCLADTIQQARTESIA